VRILIYIEIYFKLSTIISIPNNFPQVWPIAVMSFLFISAMIDPMKMLSRYPKISIIIFS